jgi:hypothetical protein
VLGIPRAALTAITIVACMALLAAGCSTDRKVTEPEPVPVTEKRLVAALLTVEDLNESFTAAAEGTPVNAELIPEHECDDAIKDLEPEEVATADFTSGTVVLNNTIAWFPGNGGAVERIFQELAEDCEAVVVAAEDLSLLTEPLRLGVVSDDMLALTIEAQLANGTIEERNLVLMREGDLLSFVRLSGPRPSDKVLLDEIVRVALGRLGLLADETS